MGVCKLGIFNCYSFMRYYTMIYEVSHTQVQSSNRNTNWRALYSGLEFSLEMIFNTTDWSGPYVELKISLLLLLKILPLYILLLLFFSMLALEHLLYQVLLLVLNLVTWYWVIESFVHIPFSPFFLMFSLFSFIFISFLVMSSLTMYYTNLIIFAWKLALVWPNLWHQ